MKALVVAMAIATILLLLPAYSAEYIVKSTETSFLDLRGRGYVISFYVPADRVRTLGYFKLVFNNNTLYIAYIEKNTTVVQGIQVLGSFFGSRILRSNKTHELMGFYFNTSLHNFTAQYMGIAIHYGDQSYDYIQPPTPSNPFIKVVEKRNGDNTYDYMIIANGTTIWSINNVERGNFSIKLYDNIVKIWINANNTIQSFNFSVKPHYIIYISDGDDGYIYPEITYHIHGFSYTFNNTPIDFTSETKDIVYENYVLTIGDYIIWDGEINYLNASAPIRVVYAVLEEDHDTTAIVASSGTGSTGTAGIPWLLLGGLFLIVIVVLALAGGGGGRRKQ